MNRDETELMGDPGAERQLTISPIVAWRRCVVSQRRPWEAGTGEVLRGAWGRAWTDPKMTAQCLKPPIRPDMMVGRPLSNVDTGRHSTPSPDPRCKCGIYAEKVNVDAPTYTPRLEGRPIVGGFVELSGTVIEGTRGYRAGEAKVIGPFELHIPCAGEIGTAPSESCPEPATLMVERGVDLVGVCETHMGADADGILVADWVDRVVPQLEATYSVSIFHFEKGGTHGHW